MPQTTYTIGIVCSGNTCRSPITAAWLKQELSEAGRHSHVRIWTAGMRVKPEDVGMKLVEDEALTVATEMNLSPALLSDLRAHRVRDLRKDGVPSDLLVWITDPSKLTLRGSSKVTRAVEMKKAADRLGATLLVIPEQDAAWQAKEDKAPLGEILSAYRAQAESLRSWSWVLFRFVP